MDDRHLIQFFCAPYVAPGAIEGWRRRGLDRLLPFQSRVLRESGLLGGKSLMIAAPPSAGKTLLAEVAMAVWFQRGRKAIYLAPTKALAEEKFAAFEQWLGPSGLRVVCATRDRPEADLAIGRGRFDLMVAVYEKLNHYLLKWPETLAAVGAVVVDEIQMLGDAERGATLDLLLTKIRLSPYEKQMIALSPPFEDCERVAKWLGCDLALDRRRPRELNEGILDLSTGVFHHRNVSTEEDGVEWIADPQTLDPLGPEFGDPGGEASRNWGEPVECGLLATAGTLARRGEATLVFAPTRSTSRHWARWLADAGVEAPPAHRSLARLVDQEPGGAIELMRRCLERGVAFHNSDVPPGLKAVIERGFNEGEIRVMVSTYTLAMGVNLAARNVIQFPWRVCGSAGGRGASLVPLGRARFINQGGRAARLGMGDEPGRSMLVAGSAAEVDRLWPEFIEADAEPTEARLGGENAAMAALDLLGGGVARTTENVCEAFGQTFSSSVGGNCAPNPLGRAAVESALQGCARQDLVRRDEAGGLWKLTGLGEVAAQLGLAPASVVAMRDEVRKGWPAALATGSAWAFDIFTLLGLTEEGKEVLRQTGLAGRRWGACGGGALDGLDEFTGEDSFAGGIMRRAGGPGREETAALVAARAMLDWIDLIPTEELEIGYGLHYGSFAKMGDQYAWLISGLAGVASVLGQGGELSRALGRLAERARAGITAEGLELARLRIRSMGRTAIGRLVAEGYDSAEALAASDVGGLAEIVGQDLARELLTKSAEAVRRKRRSRAREAKRYAASETANGKQRPRAREADRSEKAKNKEREKELSSSAAKTAAGGGNSDEDHLLKIDLRSPGIIWASGSEVHLPPLSFELLAALAERPGEVVTRGALYSRLWPDGGPEEQQLDGHRRVLIGRLTPALGRTAQGVAEVVRGIGFRLAVAPERIFLRRS